MQDRIEINPHRCHGKPVVKGTRTPVTVVLGALAGGDTFDEIAADYGITADDIRACVAFAREEIERQSYVPLSA
jgi:uncharacterized protein (DUF433 family)